MHIRLRLQVAAAFHALSLDDVIGAIQGPRMGPIRGEHFLSPSYGLPFRGVYLGDAAVYMANRAFRSHTDTLDELLDA